MSSLAISSLYVPLFAIMLAVITLRVGMYRARTKVNFGDGGDKEFGRIMRAQMNFAETVPLTLLLLTITEYQGAPAGLMHGLFAALLIARISHYLHLTGVVKAVLFRMLGMMTTFIVMLIAAGWLLLA